MKYQVHQTTAMIPLMLAILYLLSTARVDALTCYCSDCGTSDECQGDLCYAQVVVIPSSEQYNRRWRCLDRTNGNLCNTSSIFHTRICCEVSDRCNEGIEPQILSGTANPIQSEPTTVPLTVSTADDWTTAPTRPVTSAATNSVPQILSGTASPMQSEPTTATRSATSSATSSATNSGLAPILNPHPGGNEIPTSTDSQPTPSHLLAHSCYASDSTQGDGIRLCNLESWCYSSWRRRNDGSFRLKRGCATSCQPVDRTRKVKTCCRTSLCNHELLIDPLIDSNNTNVPGRISNNSLSTSVPPTVHSEPPTTPTQSTLSPSVVPPVIETESSVTTPAQTTHPPSVFYCYCENDIRCSSRICTSTIGCATQSTNINGNTVIAQICINEGSMCLGPGTECCLGQLCNRPPEPTVQTTSPNTPQSQAITGPPSVHASPGTMKLDLDTSSTDGTTLTTSTSRPHSPTASSSASPPTTSTSRPHSPTASSSASPPTTYTATSLASNKPSSTEQPISEDPVSEDLSIYYIMTIVISIITVIIAMGIIGLCAFLCVSQSKEKRQLLSKSSSTTSTQTTV